MKGASPSPSGFSKSDLVRMLHPVAAAVILSILAAYLYMPHWFQLGGMKLLLPLNSILAAMGCFVLTRRWVSSFDASLLAAVIYGFGPFGLSFVSYHPLAGLSFVVVPWLLCPAVYYHTGHSSGALKTLATTLLVLLPFAAIAGLFWAASNHWAGPLFLMPKHRTPQLTDLWGMITPLTFTTNHFAVGFYHAPLVCILMGLFVFAASGKETLLVPVMAGIVLSLITPICSVTPIVWLSFAALFFSVVAGLGLQSLAWAGKADRFWILACVIGSLLLAAANCLLGFYYPGQTAYRHAMLLFLACTAATGFIFLLAHFNLRLSLLRWIILFGLCAYDIWVTAPALVDSLF
ncbi:MAG: hypothetical protein FJ263_01990 [Planctomycetes bacterium]|nr:hypothetical protein [Planctomycetota bacterium]